MQMHTMGGAQASRPRHRSHSILQTGAGDQALMRLQARLTCCARRAWERM